MKIQQIYEQINRQTKRDYPQESIHALVAKQAVATPDKIAVLSGKKRQTYAELNQLSDQLANYLRSVGIGQGDLGGLC